MVLWRRVRVGGGAGRPGSERLRSKRLREQGAKHESSVNRWFPASVVRSGGFSPVRGRGVRGVRAEAVHAEAVQVPLIQSFDLFRGCWSVGVVLSPQAAWQRGGVGDTKGVNVLQVPLGRWGFRRCFVFFRPFTSTNARRCARRVQP